MAETQIEWTDATWNPVAGCSIVSAGCTNCYAMEMARRLQAMNVPKYKGLTRRSGKRTVWNGVVREDRAALDIPLRWKKPRKIFVNSMSDLFHDRVTDALRRVVVPRCRRKRRVLVELPLPSHRRFLPSRRKASSKPSYVARPDRSRRRRRSASGKVGCDRSR
ncbi:Phage Gp37Gp68 [Nitrobacter winogradskyi Nb-255]|uniref:Phage Gp37Gp68 n=1 Tax=Nitrobacter winogradskyi (strain ATCC 25391 / DSM 10237 / CIP 104748 / NCIMB 11846 / Nb-255) TaxID=323098 RepID=Q3SUB5_NITWN|nr:Phage Gp37Gp68 [Nitrobacter winogradskyi Nb-255]